jgi:hypothetical protein
MQKFLLGALTIGGLLIGLSATGHASPVSGLIDRDAALRTSSIVPVYYYWNHHRYRHRTWDRRYRRWRYY